MPKLLKLYLVIFGLLVLASCTNKQSKTVATIDGTSWVLQSMSEKLPAGVAINLQFEKDKISGQGVCNRYFASYKLNGQDISFQPIGATKMMCPEHSDLEFKYFEALGKAQAFSLQDGLLTITTKDGNLVFKPATTTTSMGSAKSSPNFSGQYYTGSLDEYWQSLAIYPSEAGYQVVFSASTVGDEAACHFQGVGQIEDDQLVIPLAIEGSQVTMLITKKDNTLVVSTETEEDRLALLYYCSGGASLAGTYVNKPDLILSERQLGEIALGPSVLVEEQVLATGFLNLDLVRKTGQQDGPDYTYYSLHKNTEAIRVLVRQQPEQEVQQLNTVIIYAPDIPDQYGIRTGMTFAQVKNIRSGLQLATDPHFHTYAFDKDSNIKYEICCNTDQLDKTNWIEAEVGMWTVKSIIWEAS